MPFVVPEDVGTTRRGSLSPKRRLQAWERTQGTCVICEGRIDGVRERWIVEHIRALELGGADELTNLGPAHEACARAKTRDDHARTARAKRLKIRHLGADARRHAFPSARTSPLKRKVDGTVVLRCPSVHRTAPSAPGPTPHRVDRPAGSHPAGDRTRERVESLCTQEQSSAKQSLPRDRVPMTTQTPAPGPSRPRTNRREPADGDAPSPNLPPHLAGLLTERPQSLGADLSLYEALLQSFVEQVRPSDAIEAIWVKDVVDLIWEMRQFRKWRGSILLREQRIAVGNVISYAKQDLHPEGLPQEAAVDAARLTNGWTAGRAQEIAEVEQILRGRGHSTESMTAQSFLKNLAEIERIDRMIASAESRRDTLLREIERKRASLGPRLRAASTEVIDVEPNPDPSGSNG